MLLGSCSWEEDDEDRQDTAAKKTQAGSGLKVEPLQMIL